MVDKYRECFDRNGIILSIIFSLLIIFFFLVCGIELIEPPHFILSQVEIYNLCSKVVRMLPINDFQMACDERMD